MSIVTPLLIVGAVILLLWVGFSVGRGITIRVLRPLVMELAGYVSRERCICYEWRCKTNRPEPCLSCRARALVEKLRREGEDAV